jgi:hypothetical protein
MLVEAFARRRQALAERFVFEVRALEVRPRDYEHRAAAF